MGASKHPQLTVKREKAREREGERERERKIGRERERERQRGERERERERKREGGREGGRGGRGSRERRGEYLHHSYSSFYFRRSGDSHDFGSRVDTCF